MKNRKLLKVLAAVTMSAAAVAGSITLFGCGHSHTFSDKWKNDDPDGHWYEATCEHTDEKKDFGFHEYSSETDGDCDVCGYVRHDFDITQKLIGFEGHYNPCIYDGCDVQGNIVPHTFGEDNICTDPDCGQRYASAEFRPDDLEADTYKDGYTSGFFTVLPGTTIRTRSRENYNVYDHKNGEGNANSAPIATGFTAHKSIQYNGSARGFSVKAPAPGRITVYLDNGSGGKTKQDKQTVLLTKPDGTTEVISYYCGDMYAVTINCKTAGVYKITRGDQSGVGTTDVYYAKFETVVPVTPIEKIEISNKGKTSYIKGEDFDKSGLTVDVVYSETGVKLPLDLSDPNVTVDDTAFDKTQAGKYTIQISYDAEGKSFTDSYEVEVKEVQALKLGFNKTVQGSNSSAGNGQFINKTVKQFYFKGEELNLDGLTVKTVMDEEGKEEVIVTKGYTPKGFNKNTAGKQTITVEWDDDTQVYATFDVYVASYSLADVKVTKDIAINVSKELADENVGTTDEDGAYRFKTIQQALDFLNALNGDKSKKLDNYKKLITIAEGTYKEKLEVNIPNLTIRGADLEHPEKTVIEWDSLVGVPDESGYIQITDSTATLNVRDKAIGFVIEGVTVSNWYNSEAHFTEALGANYQEHRALAMLIQADKVVIDNCRLLGYQDTIEFFTGRQLVQNTYICGRTDFIFGTNNTTYFKDCEIESIVDGGYVTAFKGCNKGDGDWVQYGAIFDGCNFTAPDTVIAKKDTSLGRTWTKYAAVAYVNCNFAGHISTTPYSSAKGTRYTAMSGAEPTDATVKFVEYNNTGAGAVDKTIAGMTYLSAADAAKYSTMSVFFGETNGKVTYKDTWDGSKGVEITTTEYRFDAEAFPDGNVEAKNENDVTQIFNGDFTVHGIWHTELSSPGKSKDFGWFSAGTTITVNKPGKVFVTTYGSPYGTPENVKISYVNNMATITIVATEDEPITGDCCISLIEIDSAQKGAHTHEYGAWVIDTPSESDKGSAVKTCENCENTPAHSVTVELPVLSATNYELTAGTTEGNVTYTYTTEDGEKIVFEAAPPAGYHVHNYGSWVITADQTTAGTATKTCNGEGDCDNKTITVNIPALSSGEYTITGNTATLDAAGTGTYTITVGEETVSFTAATPKIALKQITNGGTYYTHSTDKGKNNEYVFIDGDAYDNGSYLCFNNGSVTLNVAAGATINVSGGYYGSGWGFYKAYEKAEDGTLTELKDEVPAANKNSASFTTKKGGYIVIKKNDSQTSLTTISVVFKDAALTEITSDMTFSSSTTGVTPTDYIQFDGVQSYSGGSYWLFKTGAGTIKFKVAAGATITLKCGYWGSTIKVNGTPYNGTNNVDIVITDESGEIEIESGDSSLDVYLQSIEVTF